MWLSKQIVEQTAEPPLRRGALTIGGASPAVDADGERRDAMALAPAGMRVLPVAGSGAVIGELAGECAIVGYTADAKASEIVLEVAGGARVALGADGVWLEFGGYRLGITKDGVVGIG